MNATNVMRWAGLAAAIPLLGFLAGCGTGVARYAPTEDEAHSSLEAALTAWRDGKPFGPIDANPPVRPADTAWQRGEQIESFEIGEQEQSEEGTKQFVVKLTMKGQKQSQDVRYVVHGRDPVWVYREDEYKRMLNMDNGPTTTKRPKPAAKRTGRSR